MVVGKKFLYKTHFDGMPKPENFELVQENLPALKDGEILISSLYLSVDPYMRSYVLAMSTPMTMIGQNVAEVIESKDSDFPIGCIVLTNAGWVKTGTASEILKKQFVFL